MSPGGVKAVLKLEIYVEDGCFACSRSIQIAEHIRRRFPQVEVRLVDISTEAGEHSRLVAATPTFILNGRVFSLGNPDQERLEEAILDLLPGKDGDGAAI